MKKDFLSILDLSPEDLTRCLDVATRLKAERPLRRNAPTSSALAGRHAERRGALHLVERGQRFRLRGARALYLPTASPQPNDPSRALVLDAAIAARPPG